MIRERSLIEEHARLEQFHAAELGCDAALLGRSGVFVIASEKRARPGWGGYTVPILAVSTPGGGVVSARPDLADQARADVAARPSPGPLVAEDFERLRRLSRRAVPYAYCLSGDILYVDRDHFRPIPGNARMLQSTDAGGADLRRRFDGEIFVVRGLRGEIASWAAIKLKSNDVWELAVVTEAPYRGRGYAKQAVAAATGYILDHGRLALYIHDRTNRASARVCRALGYVEYCETFFCEY
jgi:RimJ/RimL family protein N-acetyltransferase